ncbi:MAG: hypothetical protein IKA62_08830 [Clostridia bacterium]|nr:hypothetical protein [Clostridia bacterium]
MENKRNDGFSYTYSAGEQAEIKRIREKYTAPDTEEDKMARLRRLDAQVTNKAQVTALVLGVIGTLILGFGMSLFMSELGENIGFAADQALAVGIAVGVIGAVLVSIAYPVYSLVLKHQRKKLASEIIRLTDELMK